MLPVSKGLIKQQMKLQFLKTILLFPAGGVPSFAQPEQTPQPEQQEVDTEMGPSVTIMKPILRFLQLLCENHNLDLQVWPTSE